MVWVAARNCLYCKSYLYYISGMKTIPRPSITANLQFIPAFPEIICNRVRSSELQVQLPTFWCLRDEWLPFPVTPSHSTLGLSDPQSFYSSAGWLPQSEFMTSLNCHYIKAMQSNLMLTVLYLQCIPYQAHACFLNFSWTATTVTIMFGGFQPQSWSCLCIFFADLLFHPWYILVSRASALRD